MTMCNYVPNDSAHMRFDPGNAERLLGNALLRWQPQPGKKVLERQWEHGVFFGARKADPTVGVPRTS